MTDWSGYANVCTAFLRLRSGHSTVLELLAVAGASLWNPTVSKLGTICSRLIGKWVPKKHSLCCREGIGVFDAKVEGNLPRDSKTNCLTIPRFQHRHTASSDWPQPIDSAGDARAQEGLHTQFMPATFVGNCFLLVGIRKQQRMTCFFGITAKRKLLQFKDVWTV